MSKTCIVIAGPTAVGKTDVAINVAQLYKTEIISADSRQCYSEMKIGVARPSEIQLQSVSHHFIASHSIQERLNAVSFEKYALDKINDLFLTNDVVVVTGGTGLYIRALCDGLDPIPEVPIEIRNVIIDGYESGGMSWLTAMLQEHDPLFAKQGEMQNPQRMMRALEVVKTCGKSIVSFQSMEKVERPFRIIKIALELPRLQLIERIDERVEEMMNVGLLEEVRSLIPHRSLNALQTVGYSELFDFLDGKLTMEQAVDQIKIHTRQYAKRQMTWFKKETDFHWFNPTDPNLLSNISALISKD
jgi:tRNA dimethylallyltransferase